MASSAVSSVLYLRDAAGNHAETRTNTHIYNKFSRMGISHKVGAGLSAGEEIGKIGKTRGASVQGSRVRRSPRVNFSASVVCTMKAPSWLNVDIQNGGPDLSDKISDAKMLHKEYKRAFSLREREFGIFLFFRFLSCLVFGFCFMF